MANQSYITPMEFKNLTNGETSLGFELYDSYSSGHLTIEGPMPEDDFEMLRLVLLHGNKNTQEILDFVREWGTGLTIGKTYYPWKEIQPVFNNCRALSE